MTATAQRPRSERLPRLVLASGIAALGVKLALAASTRGTNDVAAFREFADVFARSGARFLYENHPDFNHPPLVLWLFAAVRWLAETTSLSFAFWMRTPAILADLGSLWVVSRIFAARLDEPSVRTTLLLMAAAPASILISGFHGNTDPVMIFFLLLSIHWIERPGLPWLAGAAMGLSISVKVVPLAFLPAALLWLPDARRRLAFLAALAGVVVAGSAPVIFEAPEPLARKVLGYRSDYGLFGPAWLLLTMREPLAPVNDLFGRFGRHLLVLVLVGLSIWMNRSGRRPPLFRQVGVLAFTSLAVAPAFAVQYLAWLVPWIVGLPVFAAAAHVAAVGALLVLVYTCWCHPPSPRLDTNWLGAPFWEKGLPWDEAGAHLFALFRGEIVPVAIAAWLSVVLVLALQLRSLRREGVAAP